MSVLVLIIFISCCVVFFVFLGEGVLGHFNVEVFDNFVPEYAVNESPMCCR